MTASFAEGSIVGLNEVVVKPEFSDGNSEGTIIELTYGQ